MKTRFFSLGLLIVVGGCARSAAPQTVDLSGQRDLSGSDDLSAPGDLAGADAPPSDGPTSGDGGGLDGAPDLRKSDLASTADLASTDLATTPPDLTMPCSVLPQSGCNAGEKCTLGAANTPICASNGTKTDGQQCGTAGADDCVAGELCTADAPTPAPAICRVFCSSDTQCTQPAVGPAGNTAHCTITITGTPDKVCTYACNPVTNAGASGCVTGQTCVYGAAAGVPELTDCETAGTGTDNFNCAKGSDCAPGFACVGPVGMSRCRQMCRAPQNPHTLSADCANALYDCYQPAGVTSPMFGFCCDFVTGC